MGKGSDSSQAYSIYWKAVNRMVQIWEFTRIPWVWFILECLHKEDTQWYTLNPPKSGDTLRAGCIQVLPQYQLSSRLSTWNSSVIFHVANQREAACMLGRQHPSFQFGDVPPDGNQTPATESWFSFSATMTTNTYEYSFYDVLLWEY